MLLVVKKQHLNDDAVEHANCWHFDPIFKVVSAQLILNLNGDLKLFAFRASVPESGYLRS